MTQKERRPRSGPFAPFARAAGRLHTYRQKYHRLHSISKAFNRRRLQRTAWMWVLFSDPPRARIRLECLSLRVELHARKQDT